MIGMFEFAFGLEVARFEHSPGLALGFEEHIVQSLFHEGRTRGETQLMRESLGVRIDLAEGVNPPGARLPHLSGVFMRVEIASDDRRMGPGDEIDPGAKVIDLGCIATWEQAEVGTERPDFPVTRMQLRRQRPSTDEESPAWLKGGVPDLTNRKVGENGQALFKADGVFVAVASSIDVIHSQSAGQPIVDLEVRLAGDLLDQEDIRTCFLDQPGEGLKTLGQLAMEGPIVSQVGAHHGHGLVVSAGVPVCCAVTDKKGGRSRRHAGLLHQSSKSVRAGEGGRRVGGRSGFGRC